MRNHLAVWVLLVSTGLAGCGGTAVPAKPSWDQDVFPILQGSCNHCHGATVGSEATPLSRFDFCDNRPFMAAGITVPGTLLGALGTTAATIETQIVPAKGASRPLMPPPPAAPLSDYEREVLLKWIKQQAAAAAPAAGEVHTACRKQVRNRDPRALLVDKSTDGNNLVVTLDIIDLDGDQVLGKVTAGTGNNAPSQVITASGRRSFTFENLPENTDVKVLMLDGYTEIEADF